MGTQKLKRFTYRHQCSLFTAIARSGGFLGRKSDGLPGWQTLWRGWLRLQDMCWAADLITQSL
jgi:hypothetical protein